MRRSGDRLPRPKWTHRRTSAMQPKRARLPSMVLESRVAMPTPSTTTPTWHVGATGISVDAVEGDAERHRHCEYSPRCRRYVRSTTELLSGCFIVMRSRLFCAAASGLVGVATPATSIQGRISIENISHRWHRPRRLRSCQRAAKAECRCSGADAQAGHEILTRSRGRRR